MVWNFKNLRKSFSRNIINILPAASMDSKFSRTLEEMMALKTSSFHFLLEYIFIQKIFNFWRMVIVAEILFLISYLGLIYYKMDIPKYVISFEYFMNFYFEN